MFFLLLLILPEMRFQEVTPSTHYVTPRNYNHLPFKAVQFVKPIPTKKGPILFPNDAPPPPPTPLIVTSRPLSESIARSELNPNNTQTAQSEYHQVSYRPDYLARVKNYKPFDYTFATVTPVYDFGSNQVSYVDTAQKTLQESRKDNFYNDYEDDARSMEIKVRHGSLDSREANYKDDDDDKNNVIQRIIRPVYEPDHYRPEQKTVPTPSLAKYQVKTATYPNYHHSNHDDEHETSKEYNHGENYAFSYAVKDQKTGDDFSHSQHSTGSATNGEYRVLLPDGRMQVVTYTADENGYKADVRYDEHHNQDNRFDDEISREKQLRNDEHISIRPVAPINPNGHLNNQDLSENLEYLRQRYGNEKSNNFYINQYLKRPTTYLTTQHDLNHKNDFRDHTNYFGNRNDFTDTTKVHVDDKNDGLTDNNNDYLEHYNHNHKSVENEDKLVGTHDYDNFQYSDEPPLSKEIMDYSSELNQRYEPHNSKFSSFDNHKSVKSTVRPSYEELKHLFVTDLRRQNSALPVVSTVGPSYEVTPSATAIGSKTPSLYTDIKNFVSVTPPPTFSTDFASTPRGYLISTIANLQNKVNLVDKPVLSPQYINKINKYLSYV